MQKNSQTGFVYRIVSLISLRRNEISWRHDRCWNGGRPVVRLYNFPKMPDESVARWNHNQIFPDNKEVDIHNKYKRECSSCDVIKPLLPQLVAGSGVGFEVLKSRKWCGNHNLNPVKNKMKIRNNSSHKINNSIPEPELNDPVKAVT